jgi:SAM-dependent methyltransferase
MAPGNLRQDTTILSNAVRYEKQVMNEVSDPVQRLVDEMTRSGRGLRVLEAGAGSRSHIRLSGNTRLVGIDISKDQLDNNLELDERIVGDIETYPLEPCSFDIIFCWDVLEHLRHPEKALRNFLQALREDGIIVLGAPVVTSLKGIVTKYTPLWFHVMLFRYVVGNKNAGKKGHGPYPTFLRYSMSPRSIERFADKNQLSVEYADVYEAMMQVRWKQQSLAVGLAFRILGILCKIFSLGRVDPNVTDFTMVLRKSAKKSLAAAPSQGMMRPAELAGPLRSVARYGKID